MNLTLPVHERVSRRGLTLLALMLVVLVAPARPVSAFRLQGTRPFNNNIATHPTAPQEWRPFVHWDLREFDNCRIPYSLDLGGPNTADRDSSLNEIRSAFQTWNAVSPKQLRCYEVGRSVVFLIAPGKLDGFNLIGWNSGTSPSSVGDDVWVTGGLPGCGTKIGPMVPIIGAGPDGWLTTCPNTCPNPNPNKKQDDGFLAFPPEIHSGADSTISTTPNALPASVLALTFVFYHTASGRMIESDIMFNQSFNWRILGHNVPFNGLADIQTIALHEIGHFLGLHHANDALFSSPPGPIMNAFVSLKTGRTNHHLGPDDQDGLNFLYNPDLGDAPDPYRGDGKFPSKVRLLSNGRTLNTEYLKQVSVGAEHLFGIRQRQTTRNYTYEWLGYPDKDGLTSECEARLTDRDSLDDGVLIYPIPGIWPRQLYTYNIVRYASDDSSHGHDYSVHKLNLSEWLDQNKNGIWESGEKFVHANLSPGAPGGRNQVLTTVVPGFTYIAATPTPDDPMWLRARLDWGEDLGDVDDVDGTLLQSAGAAQFGEVEDYPVAFGNPTRVERPKGAAAAAMQAISEVYAGANMLINGRSALGDSILCTNSPGPSPLGSYSPSPDETDIRYPMSGPLLSDIGPEVGRSQPNDAWGSLLRSAFVPPSGIPTTSDLIPTTNSTAYETGGATHVVIGAVPAQVGGPIAGDPLTNTWNDSLWIHVVARVANAPVPLGNLSVCDPLVSGLSQTTVGDAIIHPGRPMVFDLPPLATPGSSFAAQSGLQSLILEIRSKWSVNANENLELVEFSSLNHTLDVPKAPSRPLALQITSEPNPFRQASLVRFALPRPQRASLSVFDIRGARVRELVPEAMMDAGEHAATWDGRDASGRLASAGVYFYVLRTGDERVSAKTVRIQ